MRDEELTQLAENDAPLSERYVSKAVARALVWLGKRAHDRGDKHAYEHALAALRAGDCEHSGCHKCVDCRRVLTGANGSMDDHRCWACVFPPEVTDR